MPKYSITYNQKRGLFECRLFLGRDASGKTLQKRLSNSDRAALERDILAALSQRNPPSHRGEKTLALCLRKYVQSRQDETLYSPTTYRAYLSQVRSLSEKVPAFLSMDVYTMTASDFQDFFTVLSASYSVKTLKNIRGIVSGALAREAQLSLNAMMTDETKRLFLDARRQKVVSVEEMKTPEKETPYMPSRAEVDALIKYISTLEMKNRDRIYVAVIMAAFVGMRRGEICALRMSDFHEDEDGTVYVNVSRAVVETADKKNRLKVKSTKSGKTRKAIVGRSIYELVQKYGLYGEVGSPKSLTDAFDRIMAWAIADEDSGITKHFTFQSLRHFCASWLHQTFCDKDICTQMGWSSPAMLQRIYAYRLNEAEKAMNAKIESAVAVLLPDDNIEAS